MNVLIPGPEVKGVASALPKQTFELSDLEEKFGSRKTQRIMQGTGVRSIHCAPNWMNASELCYQASIELLKNLDISAESIDGVVYITQMPDRVAPPTSVLLQHRLGLRQDVVAFDINYGCSGYIYGLYQAALLISSNSCQRVLVCAGDVITKLVHDDDILLRVLLGDAGTATLVERGNDEWEIGIYTNGAGADYLTAPSILPGRGPCDLGYYTMNGEEVMKFGLGPNVCNVIKQIYEAKKWCKNEFTLFLHQANAFMVNLLRLKMGLHEKNVPIEVETVGNTGPASVPLLLSMRGEDFKQSDRLEKTLLCGFGVGLSWGAIGLNMSKAKFIAPLEIE